MRKVRQNKFKKSSFDSIGFMQLRPLLHLRPKTNALLFCVLTFSTFLFASSFVYKFFYAEAFARGVKLAEPVNLNIAEPRIDKNSIIKLSKLKKDIDYQKLYSSLLISKSSPDSLTFKPEDSSDEFKINLAWDQNLQSATQILMDKMNIAWGSIVALDPSTGRVLAIASRQEDSKGPLALRSTFPAASVFKIITASAAVESKGLGEYSVIGYRGGNYTLNKSNYSVNNSSDTRRMLLGEALGKSCNPVFGRLALGYIGQERLKTYAEAFLFNKEIPFDFNVQRSKYLTPSDDLALARTGAGFESSFISPLHAAILASTFANKGLIMKPYLVDSKTDSSGYTEKTTPRILTRAILESTASEVSEMMEYTTTSGTAKRFFKNFRTNSNQLAIGKTGTLSGTTPQGRYHWFVGLAPKNNPKIAIAALVIDKGKPRVNGSGLARAFLDNYFSNLEN